MISTYSHARKFNLLFLEEGEQYISELAAQVRCFDTQYSSYRKFDCSVHFCSRSLLIEPHEDSKPIYKYLFKFLNTLPVHSKTHLSKLTSECRITTERLPSSFECNSINRSSVSKHSIAIQTTLNQLGYCCKSSWHSYRNRLQT